MLALAALCTASLARDVPDNVRSFMDKVREKGQCDNVLAGGFHSSDGDSGDFDYCGDFLDDYNIVYLQGKGGALANMDIDCDGVQGGPADDGRCGSSSDTQSQTTFQYDVAHYGADQRDLDANVHPYVVFGNEGDRKGWPTFDPREHGIEPLSVMAVVCNDRLVRATAPRQAHPLTGRRSMASGAIPTVMMVTRRWWARRPSPWPRRVSAIG